MPTAAGLLNYAIPFLAASALAMSMTISKRILRDVSAGRFMYYRSLAGIGLIAVFIPGSTVRGVPTPVLVLLFISVLLVPYMVNLLFFTAVRKADVGSANAALQTTPVFVVLFDVLILGTETHPVVWMSLGVILCGVLILITGSGQALPVRAGVLAVGAAAANGLGLVLMSLILQAVGRNTLMIAQNAAYFSIATAVHLRANSKQRSTIPLSCPVIQIVLLSICSGLLVQGVFFYLRLVSVERIGPVVTSALVLTQLPLTMLFSYIFLGTIVPRKTIAAAALILLGAIGVTIFS